MSYMEAEYVNIIRNYKKIFDLIEDEKTLFIMDKGLRILRVDAVNDGVLYPCALPITTRQFRDKTRFYLNLPIYCKIWLTINIYSRTKYLIRPAGELLEYLLQVYEIEQDTSISDKLANL
jgi:hypothetical protein